MNNKFFEEEIKIENTGVKEQLQAYVNDYAKLVEFKGWDFSGTDKLKQAIEFFGEAPPIELLEAVVKHYNMKKNDILINKIPDLMRELGISKMTMGDDTTVSLTQEVNVTNTNKSAMCKWLKQNGHDNDVKNILQFEKGQYNPEIEEYLRSEGYSFSIGEDIHYPTLKKIMRLRLEQQNIVAQRKEELKAMYGENWRDKAPKKDIEKLLSDIHYATLPPEEIAKVSVFEMAKIRLPE